MKNQEISVLPVYDNNGFVVYKYSIPINFTHFHIPFICLKYHEVRIKLNAEKIKDIPYNIIKKHNENKELNPIFQYLPKELKIEIIKWTIHFQHIFKCEPEFKIGLQNIFLEPEERRKFAQELHEHLIEDHQFTRTVKKEKNQAHFSTQLFFNHSVKYICVFVSNSENKIDLNHKFDPIIKLRMVLNGSARYYLDPLFLRVTEPKHLIGKETPLGVYLVSYALKPQEWKPSGTLNFSRINNVTLEIVFPPNSPEYYISVTACNYNVIKFMSGMAGLAF